MSSNALRLTQRRHLACRSSFRAAILLAHEGSLRAADKMVGGEFATKGVVISTVGPNDATGQPASVLTFTDDEVKKLHDGHYSAALLFQTSSDWADAVTRGAQDEFKALGVEIAGLSNSNFSASDQAHAVQTIMAKKTVRNRHLADQSG